MNDAPQGIERTEKLKRPTFDELKGTQGHRRYAYWPKKQQLSHEDNARFRDTFHTSCGRQYATDRITGAHRRVDLLQIPGANRAEKLALARAYRKQQRKERLAAK